VSCCLAVEVEYILEFANGRGILHVGMAVNLQAAGVDGVEREAHLVQSAGNLELRVSITVLNTADVIVLYLHPLILLQNNLAEPFDKECNLLMMFPVCAGQHWSLLVLVVNDRSL
jgi:hypothetical protein